MAYDVAEPCGRRIRVSRCLPTWLPVLAALRLQQVLTELDWQIDDGD